MKKENFATPEKLREAIVKQHKEEPNTIVLMNSNAAIALQRIARVLIKQKGRRIILLAIEYDGELHYFNDSKKKILFLLQEQKKHD